MDGTLVYKVSGTGVQANLPISTGSHSVTVQASNASGVTYQKRVSVNIVPVPIKISSPVANAITSPVKVTASAPANSPVKKMSLYVDHVFKYKATEPQSVIRSVCLLANTILSSRDGTSTATPGRRASTSTSGEGHDKASLTELRSRKAP